jgi:hypothetical protein
MEGERKKKHTGENPALPIPAEVHIPSPIHLVQLGRPHVVALGKRVREHPERALLAGLEPLESFGAHHLQVAPGRRHQVVVGGNVCDEGVRAVAVAEGVGECHAVDDRCEKREEGGEDGEGLHFCGLMSSGSGELLLRLWRKSQQRVYSHGGLSTVIVSRSIPYPAAELRCHRSLSYWRANRRP